jgi:hypothetical protein
VPFRVNVLGRALTLSDDCLVRMGEVLLHTKKAERGFPLCLRRGLVEPDPEQVGGRASIRYRGCVSGEMVGTFHTHPGDDSRPSWGDAYNILVHGFLGCRGGTRDRHIRCDAPARRLEPEEVALLRRLWRQLARTEAVGLEPLLSTVAYFAVEDIPKFLERERPAPFPAPRLRAVQVDFQGSKYIKYVDERGEVVRVERVY